MNLINILTKHIILGFVLGGGRHAEFISASSSYKDPEINSG